MPLKVATMAALETWARSGSELFIIVCNSMASAWEMDSISIGNAADPHLSM
jgi:hypothetical protein